MTHPTFHELATDLVDYHPPKDAVMAELLGTIRGAFRDAIDVVAVIMPEGPDATIAARRIHDACQACIFAIVHEQGEVPPAAPAGFRGPS